MHVCGQEGRLTGCHLRPSPPATRRGSQATSSIQQGPGSGSGPFSSSPETCSSPGQAGLRAEASITKGTVAVTRGSWKEGVFIALRVLGTDTLHPGLREGMEARGEQSLGSVTQLPGHRRI